MPTIDNQYVDRTGAINKIPFKPNLITSLGFFKTQTTTSDAITFDERDNRLVVLDDHLRNVDKKNGIDPKEYKQHTLLIPHYPIEGTITVNQLKGIRNFDTDVEQSIESAVSEELEKHTEQHDNHLEYLQAKMICSGQFATTNFGTYDMFTEFGVTKQEADIDFTDTEALEPQFRALTNKIKKAYKGGRSSGYICLAGADFFNSFVSHADIREGYVFTGNSPLRNELGAVANGYNSFQYGNILMVQYDDIFTLRDGSSDQPLADDAAVLLPRGNMGQEFFAPVSKLSGIGQSGQKRYASSYRDPKDRFVECESEQNTLVILQEIEAVQFLSIKE
jgi:hypothetical protein